MANIRLGNLLKTVIPVCVIFMAPVIAHAEWYWLTIPEDPTIGEFTELTAVEYAVTSIPKDQLQTLPETFMETMDLTQESEACSDEYSPTAVIKRLRDFDTENDFYKVTEATVQGDVRLGTFYTKFSTTTNQNTIDSRDKLLKSIETKANDCLEREQQEITENIHAEKIKAALNECDFEYFENEMTDDERMKTWDERQACKTKLAKKENDEEEEEEKLPTVSQPTTSTPEATTAPDPSPVSEITDTTETTPIPTKQVEQKEPSEKTEVVKPTTTPIVTEETATKTAPEPTRFTAEPEPQKSYRPSFFNRVANFFVNLFSW